MKKLLALLLVLVLSISVCSAAFAEAETQTLFWDLSHEELVEYYLAEANEVVITDTHVTFTDDSGRGEISIAKNPQNAAILYGSFACLWTALFWMMVRP